MNVDNKLLAASVSEHAKLKNVQNDVTFRTKANRELSNRKNLQLRNISTRLETLSQLVLKIINPFKIAEKGI